ncbi:hypothetical protein Daesc_005244 [Daldinia eschscholtzii]|uniref:Photolyase/cryptochrome alpha/beta domain-containing protein n=1 Tax=Daldinia eschscholtzii TaxID=292717 RepID=A0AAX6MKM1_9PEZI
MGKPRVIYWFRTDLRLHDSPALRAALDLDPTWDVTHLVFEKDTDAYARERDRVVIALAEKAGIQVVSRYGRTLWDSDEVVAKHGGKPTMSITQLQAAGKKVGEIPRPIPAPDYLPDPGDMPIDFEQRKPETEPDINAPLRDDVEDTYSHIAGPQGDFAIATLDELGFSAAPTTPHRGGETNALKQLEGLFSDEKYAATFQKPKTSPAAFQPQSTTLLSPMLHFGALSPRLFYWKAQDLVEKYGKGASTPPESLTGQLLFRDMYFAAYAAIGSPFVQTINNAYCRFIPWHLPSKIGETETGGNAISGEYHVDSPQAEEWFVRWKMGVTGFPFVDAMMRQLRIEGWIHHLGRHMVACFLTRGGCYVHWERGADVFEEWLIDHEPASNAGNWQWMSCTAFYSQYYRCYSPIAFGQKWDKKGEFIRKWVPELKNLDEKFIYEPWKASKAALDEAGVIIEGDGLHEGTEGTYPAPMFDFGQRRSACIAAMKRAYSIGIYGNNDKAKDGTWKRLFEEAGETEMEGFGGSSSGKGQIDQASNQDESGKGGLKHANQGIAVKEGPMDKFAKRLKK